MRVSASRAVCHREEETYPIVYRTEVWFFRIRARESDFIRVRDDELPVVSICLTAMFSDMFEANGLSINAMFWKQDSRCRAMGIDNESDQVP